MLLCACTCRCPGARTEGAGADVAAEENGRTDVHEDVV